MELSEGTVLGAHSSLKRRVVGIHGLLNSLRLFRVIPKEVKKLCLILSKC